MILPLFGGYFIDKVGIRTSLFLFSLLTTLGHAIFSLGVWQSSYLISLIGRGIFGCGGENLNLGQTLMIIQWFSSKELSMAIGMSISIGRLGSVLGNNAEPIVLNLFGLNAAVWFGFLTCVLSLLACVFLMNLDKKRDKLLGITEKHVVRDEDKFTFSGMKNLGPLYWFMVLNSTMVYSSIYCFTFVSSSYYQDRFSFDSVQAGFIISIVFFTGMIFCPIAGIFTDKFGQKGALLIISAACVGLVHCLFIWTQDSYRPILPIFYLLLLGLGYSIYTTVFWAAMSNVVQGKSLGTAFGLSFSVSNLGLVIGPLVVGYIQENTEKDHGYYWVSVFLAILALIGFISGVIVYVLDANGPGVIDSKQHKNIEEILQLDIKPIVSDFNKEI